MKKILLATAATLALTAPAWAGTYQADNYSLAPGAQVVTLNGNEPVYAGEVHFTGPDGDLLVWCLDVMDILHTPFTYQESTYNAGDARPGMQTLSAPQLEQIASLMLNGLNLGGPNASDDDAATQLAIWQVEYGPSFSSNASGTLLSQFNLELTQSAAGGSLDCPGCTLTVLSGSDNQAMGFAAVPGPIVGAGLPGLIAGCFGLLGLGKYRRRRSGLTV